MEVESREDVEFEGVGVDAVGSVRLPDKIDGEPVFKEPEMRSEVAFGVRARLDERDGPATGACVVRLEEGLDGLVLVCVRREEDRRE